MSKHHNGMYYIQKAEKHGLQVSMGKGDHYKIKAPVGRGFMIVPAHNRDLPTGTECAIRKFFKALGILLVLALAVIVMV